LNGIIDDFAGINQRWPSTTIMLSPLVPAHEYTRSTVKPEGIELIDWPHEMYGCSTWRGL